MSNRLIKTCELLHQMVSDGPLVVCGLRLGQMLQKAYKEWKNVANTVIAFQPQTQRLYVSPCYTNTSLMYACKWNTRQNKAPNNKQTAVIMVKAHKARLLSRGASSNCAAFFSAPPCRCLSERDVLKSGSTFEEGALYVCEQTLPSSHHRIITFTRWSHMNATAVL